MFLYRSKGCCLGRRCRECLIRIAEVEPEELLFNDEAAVWRTEAQHQRMKGSSTVKWLVANGLRPSSTTTLL